jgi:hypothetical protein
MLGAAILAITGPVTTITFDGYTGSGFTPTPGAGQLDSNSWQVTGMNDGDMVFGGTFVGGDFGEGASSGGVSGPGTGGLWAFDVAPGDPAFGFQQSADDLTPGNILFRIENDTGAAIVDPVVHFDAYTWNDSTRASVMEFAWSTNGVAFTDEPTLVVTTPEAPDASVAWRVQSRQVQLRGTVEPGAMLQLRWATDALSGTGGFDEMAIDNIEIDASSAPATSPDAGPAPVPPAASADAGTPDNGDGGGYTANGCDAGGGGSFFSAIALLLATRASARRGARAAAPGRRRPARG